MYLTWCPQLTLKLTLLILCLIGQVQVNANRQRRQAAGTNNNRNLDIQSGNTNLLISSNNVQYNSLNNRNNPQQPNNNLLASSQGQAQQVRSRGYYNSPQFKPPTFSGEKPTGWFDTKYPNWVSNQDTQYNKNSMIDGKNAPPSSLQAKSIQSSVRDDGGPFFLEKVAKQYVSQGDKSFNMAQYRAPQGRYSVCMNRYNYNGYTFGKFICPLPSNTGMNQLDQFCCGIANYQCCCNEQEYNREKYGDSNYSGKNRHPKHSYYSPSRNRALAIILPIVGVLVAAGAVVIVIVYYKRIKKDQSKNGNLFGTKPSNDNYSAVPQDAPIEKPIVPPRDQKKNVNA